MTGASVRAQTSRSRSRFGPAHRAVLGDVGDHVPGRAGLVEPLQHLEQVAAVAGPAPGREGTAAHVEPDRDPVAVLAAPPGRTTAGSSSAAVPMLTRAAPVASAARSDSSSRMPPDSSTFTSSRPTTSASRCGVGAAAERGVEVDQVDPLGAVVLPGQRRLQRVAVDGLGAGGALHQPDGLAVGDVHGGQQGEASRSFSSDHGTTVRAAIDRRSPAGRAAISTISAIRSARSSTNEPDQDQRRDQRHDHDRRPARPRLRRGTAGPAPPASRRQPAHQRPAALPAPRPGAAGPPARGPARPAAPPSRARSGSRAPARSYADDRAGRGDPVAQQRGAGVAGLLRVELGRATAGRARPRRRTARRGWRWSPRRRRRRAPPGRRRVRVDEVEPRVARAARRTAPTRPAPSTVFQPMCGTRCAASRVTAPGSSPSPLVTTPCSSPESNRICMPTQMPSTGRPAADPVGDDRARRRAPSMPAMQAAYAPTPGHDQPVGGGRRGQVGGDRHVGAGARPAPARPSAGCPSRSRAPRPAARISCPPAAARATPPAAASTAERPPTSTDA